MARMARPPLLKLTIMLKPIHHDALLTLALPVGLEEDLIDFLLAHPEWASGFTLLPAQGLGQGVALRTPMEMVQGRSGKRLIMIAGAAAALHQLVAALAEEFPNPQVGYWMAPLLACGRLA